MTCSPHDAACRAVSALGARRLTTPQRSGEQYIVVVGIERFQTICGGGRHTLRRGDLVIAADPAGTQPDVTGCVVAGLAAAGFGDAEVIGRGNFGVVYRCIQERVDRLVAVKVLAAISVEDRARFVREQQAMGRLTGHPNIAALLQVGELEGGAPYLVMPYCERGSVQAAIARAGRLAVAEVLRLGVKVAAALDSAHRLGIVHRDVKPANILFTDYGEPALCDFGIARVIGAFETDTGAVAGSPAYTAPEVISGAVPSTASDVYGLGATLFAALTGHTAFERRVGENVVAQFLRITREPVPDLREQGVPEDIAEAIGAAMARDPGERPSPLQLARRLQQAQARRAEPVEEMALREGPATTAAPMPAPAPVPRGNLPALVTAMVGRGAEVARLGELLKSSRLVTLTGMGGIGKTTLATHAAHELGPGLAEGVWLVELADLGDATLLTDVVAGALGVREQPGLGLAASIVDFLTARRALLVLDNCEHLIGEVAQLVVTLLRDCPLLHILATSREVLNVGGEAVLALAPLACPDPTEGDPTVRTASRYAAVELFTACARAVQPDFSLTAANAAVVARICARLEGMPLALRLAAARVPLLSVAQIAEGLSDRFALLTHGRRVTSTRQHTLAGCMDWSYQLCSPAEQRLWAALATFAGSFDLPAAQHLSATELTGLQCLELMGALADKSILTRDDRDGDTARYRLLDTVRDYGRTQLAEADHHHLRHRHATYYQDLLAQANDHWRSEQQVRWLNRITAELPNIREALRLRLTSDPTAALQMTAHLYGMWVIRGMHSEGRQWINQALSATAPEPTALRVLVLQCSSLLASMQGDLDAARTAITDALTAFDAIDRPAGDEVLDFNFFGAYLALCSGDLGRAREGFMRSLDETDDYATHSFALLFLGFTWAFLGDRTQAMHCLDKALTLAESRGDLYLGGFARVPLGFVLWKDGQSRRSEQVLRQSLEDLSALNERMLSSYAMEELAWIAASEGTPRRAAVLMAAAQALRGTLGATVMPLADAAAVHEQCEHRIRQELGPDDFQTAWAEGSALTFEQAVAFARGTHPPHPAATRTADQPAAVEGALSFVNNGSAFTGL